VMSERHTTHIFQRGNAHVSRAAWELPWGCEMVIHPGRASGWAATARRRRLGRQRPGWTLVGLDFDVEIKLNSILLESMMGSWQCLRIVRSPTGASPPTTSRQIPAKRGIEIACQFTRHLSSQQLGLARLGVLEWERSRSRSFNFTTGESWTAPGVLCMRVRPESLMRQAFCR